MMVLTNVEKKANEYQSRFNVEIIPGDGSSDELNESYLPDADIIFCAAQSWDASNNKKQLGIAKKAMILQM